MKTLVSMGTTKRIIYVVLIASLFGVAVYHVTRIVQHEPQETIYRGVVDDSTYLELLRQEKAQQIKQQTEQQPISLGEYIIAGFAAITAMMGIFKYFEEKRINELSVKVDTVLDVVMDRQNKDKVISKIREVTMDWVHNVDNHDVKRLIQAIGDRSEKFANETMVQNLTADDLACAEVNASNRSIETSKQLRELNVTDEFRSAVEAIQATHVINLIKELQTILDDRMRNHKYERYGKAVTDFLRAFLRDIAKADTKYN